MNSKPFEGTNLVVTGGTGSLGKLLVRRLLTGEMGMPNKIVVFSRDEAKQHDMRLSYLNQNAATDDVVFQNSQNVLQFWIGDVRDFDAVTAVLRDANVVFNAAALKQVPTAEYFPYEAVQTNITGAENIVRAIQNFGLNVDTVVGISTDKACHPVNVMGMTKAVQERVFIHGNMRAPQTRMLVVRYGNVLASRGSVIPLFHEQIRNGGPVTITSPEMTRFLLSLDDAVDTVFAAVRTGNAGETYVPRAPASLVTDIAVALIGDRDVNMKIVGIRPGEKIHEAMVNGEEALRTVDRNGWFAIKPMLPELSDGLDESPAIEGEFSSKDNVLSLEGTRQLLAARKLLIEDVGYSQEELLR